MVTKNMPGWDEMQERVKNEKARKERLAQKRIQELNDADRRLVEKLDGQNLEQEKLRAVKQVLMPQYVKDVTLPSVKRHLLAFLASALMMSGIWGLANMQQDDKDGDAMSYGQFAKNAVLFDDMLSANSNLEERAIGGLLGIGFYGFACMLIALSRPKFRERSLKQKANDKLAQANQLLNEDGVLGAKHSRVFAMVGQEILAVLSEKDKRFVERLLDGKIDSAGYSAACAIIRGALVANPNIYQKVVDTYSKKSLPNDIVAQIEQIAGNNTAVWGQFRQSER